MCPAADVENVFRVKGHLVRRVSDDALHFRVASLRWTMHPSRGSFRFSAPEGEPSLYSKYYKAATVSQRLEDRCLGARTLGMF